MMLGRCAKCLAYMSTSRCLDWADGLGRCFCPSIIYLARKRFLADKSKYTSVYWKVTCLTDMLSGSKLVERTFTYLTSVTKECRKAVTEQFGREHKGMPFNSVEKVMRQAIESWFAKRDPNIKLSHEKSVSGRAGEILMIYSGSTKGAHFQVHIDGLFTCSGPSSDAPSYLKNLNLYVDKRDFTK
jgi:hypothetical protein